METSAAVLTRSLARFLTFVALFADASEGSTMKLERQQWHSLRSQHIRHHKHSSRASDPKADIPLYDAFVDIMNHAAEKALEEKRVTSAYVDFRKLYLEKKSEHAEHLDSEESDEMPTREDFKQSLKASVSAADEAVQTYDDFLSVIVVGAEQAMHDRETSAEDADDSQVEVTEGREDRVTEGREDRGPFDAIKKGMEEAGKVMDKAEQEAENTVTGSSHDKDRRSLRKELARLKEKKKRRGPIPRAKKPLMKKINVLRTELCWKRPNLMKHEKCLRFLGISCFEESTGLGICHEFTEDCVKACKTETDPDWKEDYCALADALDDQYLDEEDHDHSSQASESSGHDGGTEAVKESANEDEMLDKDLDEVLEEKDKKLEGDASKDGQEKKASGDAAAKGAGVDSDGDGVMDDKDLFPNDANEWADLDKDGIGDNSDDDIDGDGKKNGDDAFPKDPKEWSDIDNDGIGDNADTDRDNDGYENDKDVFPDDPSEWKDSDKDGIGDNKDAHPFNPNCHLPDDPCEDASKENMPKKGSKDDPATLDMSAERKLPEQGYNEYSRGPKVRHNNYYTWVGDWGDEWPTDERRSEKQEISSICDSNPSSPWCKTYIEAMHRGEEGSWR